jgi:hypothetical protein
MVRRMNATRLNFLPGLPVAGELARVRCIPGTLACPGVSR